MTDNFKRILFLAVGALSISQDKLKDLIEDLVMNSDFTHDEGERIVNDFLFEVEKYTQDWSSNFWTLIDDVLEKLNLPERDNINETVEELRTRLQEFLKKTKEQLPVKKDVF